MKNRHIANHGNIPLENIEIKTGRVASLDNLGASLLIFAG
jgi:hypothetical protein